MRTDPVLDERPTHGDVGVLVKTLDLLEALADADPMTVAEVSSASGVNKAAAYRILSTLERRAYVVRTPDEVRRYTLGPALRALSREVASPADLLLAARPRLRTLWEEYGETVNLGVLSDDRVLYLDIVESDQGLRTTVTVGAHDALHCTALGKAMLAALPSSEARALLARSARPAKTPRTLTGLQALTAELDRVREKGYALDDEENESGARCVAAAVLGPEGQPLGALSVSAPAWRMPDQTVEEIGRRLRAVCDEVAGELG